MREEAVLCQPQMVAIVAVTAVLFPPTACERIMVIQLQVGAARTRRLSLVSYQTLFHWTDFFFLVGFFFGENELVGGNLCAWFYFMLET